MQKLYIVVHPFYDVSDPRAQKYARRMEEFLKSQSKNAVVLEEAKTVEGFRKRLISLGINFESFPVIIETMSHSPSPINGWKILYQAVRRRDPARIYVCGSYLLQIAQGQWGSCVGTTYHSIKN